mmetsp:Transcript_12200/g.33859  ORF Transcript_12200/g.33859 Transcript_12200/m.33859 type:complete len:314 (+) Transcript_12200:263-1204(+)
MPSREEMLRRDSKVYRFWDANEKLLETAWKEWQVNDKQALALPKLDSSLIHPELRAAVEAVWENPTESNERALKNLWKEVSPGVYDIPFFDMDKIHIVRQWFDQAADAGIPTRPPYGIVLNRKGFMIDPRSVGYLAAPDFQTWYRDLVDTYVRPLGRLFFPEAILPNDDSETFAFSIQYQGQEGGDKSIRPHSDASTITFNINLDEEKTWTGSSLIFYNGGGDNRHVEWAPGHAVMHLGRKMHAAVPIESGTRSNLVIWTMGKGGGMGYGSSNSPMAGDNGEYPEVYRLSPEQRWVKPEEQPPTQYLDRWSPF